MIKHLETDFLDKQLTKAKQEQTAGQWEQAQVHFQCAFNEALWLCNHYIDHQQVDLTKEAYNLLKVASQGYNQCNLDKVQTVHLSQQIRDINNKMRNAFGLLAEALVHHQPAFHTRTQLQLAV